MLLADLLKGEAFQNLPDEPDEKVAEHRSKHKERPKEEVDLLSLAIDPSGSRRTTSDPTPDLVEISNGLQDAEFLQNIKESGYLVWCAWSRQTWFCHNKECLNMNFIYRGDLEIIEFTKTEDALNFYKEHGKLQNPGYISSKVCYLLDSPPNESYELYHESNYPSLKYGKATPNGMFVHKYQDRFHRDMAVLEIDDLYSNQSSKKAGKLVSRPYNANEAIIVSDGAWMKESCSSSFVYLDNTTLIEQTVGHCPSDVDQAVLISEIVGALEAIKCAVRHKKTKITYYYDNTSILNVWRNHKTEYIAEIKEYKDYLNKIHKDGYEITFIELHPKSGEDRKHDNKALMFFHNLCDQRCRDMADMFTKDYRLFATDAPREGETFNAVKERLEPKPKNKNSGGFKQNAHGGNNKYGRRF